MIEFYIEWIDQFGERHIRRESNTDDLGEYVRMRMLTAKEMTIKRRHAS